MYYTNNLNNALFTILIYSIIMHYDFRITVKNYYAIKCLSGQEIIYQQSAI